jgi:hypothetical protein
MTNAADGRLAIAVESVRATCTRLVRSAVAATRAMRRSLRRVSSLEVNVVTDTATKGTGEGGEVVPRSVEPRLRRR